MSVSTKTERNKVLTNFSVQSNDRSKSVKNTKTTFNAHHAQTDLNKKSLQCTRPSANFYFLHRRIFIFCFSEPLGINIEEYEGLMHCTRLFIQIHLGVVCYIFFHMSIGIHMLTIHYNKWIFFFFFSCVCLMEMADEVVNASVASVTVAP